MSIESAGIGENKLPYVGARWLHVMRTRSLSWHRVFSLGCCVRSLARPFCYTWYNFGFRVVGNEIRVEESPYLVWGWPHGQGPSRGTHVGGGGGDDDIWSPRFGMSQV